MIAIALHIVYVPATYVMLQWWVCGVLHETCADPLRAWCARLISEMRPFYGPAVAYAFTHDLHFAFHDDPRDAWWIIGLVGAVLAWYRWKDLGDDDDRWRRRRRKLIERVVPRGGRLITVGA